jgi:arylsulfatase A-like enzyme
MEKKRPPNVVFVLTDDQGYGDLGCHGNAVIKTPNLDRFHAESVRFTDFHVGTTCAPTRAGLLTGRYCNSTGVWHTIGGRSLLREDEWTLANAFQEVGYRTGHFGKWHLGDSQPLRPHERGFDETVYHAGGGIGNTGDPWGNDYFDDTYYVNGTPKRFKGYCTDVFFREALDFIENHSAGPFFCYIATNAPHSPLNVESQYTDLYRASTPHNDRARFYGMITNIDENFGMLRDKLKELGLTQNTIVLFMTDNGTASGVDLDSAGYPIEGRGSYNAGMRGKKGSPYEGGHRVPFMVRYPDAGIKGGRDIDPLTGYIDFMPTLLELCGIPKPSRISFHGRSLVPLMREGPGGMWEERVIFTDTQRIPRPMKWRKSAVMKSKWRLINGTQLYDLHTDPGERTDIADKHPEMVHELRAEYEKWWDVVSKQYDRDVPIAIGKDEEPVTLTTHDIRNESCAAAWNQRMVRQGSIVSGFWAIDVRRAGSYAIEMRRWPEETGYPVTTGIEGDDIEWRKDCIRESDTPHYSGGVALNIRWARLEVGGRSYHREVDEGSAAVVFPASLLKGRDRLFAAFYDESERTIAPYYVYVRKIDRVTDDR